MAKKFEVSDLDGSNKRQMTLAQLRAEIDAAKEAAMNKFRADAKRAGLPVHPRWQ